MDPVAKLVRQALRPPGIAGPQSTATVVLALAAVASGVLLLAFGSSLTFFLDEWEFLLYRRGFTSDAILSPHGEHISVIPVLVYKALLATFGMDSPVAFRVVATVLFLTSAVLLYAWLRGRIGDTLALIGTTLILFLGAAWEALLLPFSIGFFGSMVSGLGMLLVLRRGDRRTDALACALLTVATAFSSLWLPFAVGAAVYIAQDRGRWRRRAYVVAVPCVLYGLWWIGWGHTAESAVSVSNILTAPAFLIEGVGSAILSLLGLVNPKLNPVYGNDAEGHVLLLGVGTVAGGIAAWRVRQLGRVPPWLWVVAAIAIAFWLLAGINEKPGRAVTVSRFQYIGAILVLLAAAELVHGIRLGRRAVIIVSIIAAAAVLSNVWQLGQARNGLEQITALVRADLGAVEIARDTVNPELFLSEGIARTRFINVRSGAYLSAVHDFGSPAYTPDGIAGAGEPARVAADSVLASALRVEFSRVGRAPSAAGPAPRLTGPSATGVHRRRGCLVVELGEAGSPTLSLPPDGATVRAERGGEGTLRLRRFSLESFPIYAGTVRGGEPAVLDIPTDRASEPWELELAGSGRVTVCGRSDG